MRIAFVQLIVSVVMALSFVIPGDAQEFTPLNLLALREQATLKRLSTYEAKHRLAYYETMNRLVNRLRTSSTLVKIKTIRSTAFGSGYPRLLFFDRDGDGLPDEWQYLSKNGNDNQEFGFIFDTNGDGHADYIVFNGGIDMSFANNSFKFIWWNIHLIDTNHDGHFDVMVVNDISLHKPHVVDNGVSAWLYDSNHDGKIDTAEYLGPGIKKPLARVHGKFRVQYSALGTKDYPADEMRGSDHMFHELETVYASLVSSLPHHPIKAPTIKPETKVPLKGAKASHQLPNLIDMGNFELPRPSGSGWQARIDRHHQTASFTKKESGFGNAVVGIKFNPNWPRWAGIYTTEEEVADDYSMGELTNMRSNGTKVKDVRRGVMRLQHKKIYYMRYRISGSVSHDAILFLYFPMTFSRNHYFYVFVLDKGCRGSCIASRADFQPVIDMIDAMQIK